MKTRSETDWVSNNVVLRGIDSVKYLEFLSERPPQVNEAIPQFLHEFTHLWCFDSRVGRSIAFLKLRAAHSCRTDEAKTPEDGGPVSFSLPSQRFDARNDLVRYRTVTAAYKGLAEGLALFAEFDTRESFGKIRSAPMNALRICFGFRVPKAVSDRLGSGALSGTLLQNTRLSPALLERKAAMFWRPFDPKDGYLPGYLAVKGIHNYLQTKAYQFRDPDFFLSYLRSYLFEDAVLAKCLLAEEPNEILAAKAIVERINYRVKRLMEAEDLPELASTYEDNVADGFGDTAMTRGVAISEDEVDEASAEFTRAVKEFASRVGSSEEDKILGGAVLHMLKERSLMVIAREDVEFEYRGSKLRCTASGRLLATLPTLNTSLRARAVFWLARTLLPRHYPAGMPKKGTLMAVTGLHSPFVALVIQFPSGKPASIQIFGLPSPDTRRRITEFVATRSLIEDAYEKLETNLVEVESDDLMELLLERALKDTYAWASDLLATLATAAARDESVERAKSQLVGTGLQKWLCDDPDMARSLAAIGLINQVWEKTEMVVDTSVLLELDREVVRDHVSHFLTTDLPMPLVAKRGDDTVIALV